MEPYLKSIIGSEDWLWISGEKGEEIEKVIAEAVRDFEENSANTRQHSLDCYHMLLLFMEGTPQKAKETQPVWEKYVQPVTARIETSYMEDLSAEKLAQSVYVSPQYLSRLFVRYFNCSVYEYLTAYRINRAKELLIMEHDRKVQEIAHDVGYTDASHFIVMFKKLTGMTPVEFRKLHV